MVLPAAAAKYGDKTALIVPERAFSFRELDGLSSAVAASLVKLGVAPGDRVTLYAPNSWEWLVSYYGSLKTGAVINPINVMLTPAEVAYITRDCGAKALIGSRDKLGPALEAGVTGLTTIAFGTEPLAGAIAFDELISKPATFEPVAIDPGRPSTIGYTSGTTGHPKGAMQSHRAVILNGAMTAQMHGKTAADIVVTALPCPHVYGNVVFNGAMMYGLTLVLHSRFDAAEALGSIQSHRATMFEGVPTMYMYMLAHPDLERFELSTLSRCTVGGQTMPVAKMQEVEQRFGCPLIELWGMTEIAGLGTTFPSYGPHTLGSIGIALPHCEAKIASVNDATVTMSAGEVGELMIKGPIVMMGYWGNEAATREVIEPDGWLHTGDLAYMDEDGFFRFVDRAKDLIIRGGENIFPVEIEGFLLKHPKVQDVAVMGYPHPRLVEIVMAVIQPREGETLTDEEVLEFCKEKGLAKFKWPEKMIYTKIPRNPAGKIEKPKLRDTYVKPAKEAMEKEFTKGG